SNAGVVVFSAARVNIGRKIRAAITILIRAKCSRSDPKWRLRLWVAHASRVVISTSRRNSPPNISATPRRARPPPTRERYPGATQRLPQRRDAIGRLLYALGWTSFDFHTWHIRLSQSNHHHSASALCSQ